MWVLIRFGMLRGLVEINSTCVIIEELTKIINNLSWSYLLLGIMLCHNKLMEHDVMTRGYDHNDIHSILL